MAGRQSRLELSVPIGKSLHRNGKHLLLIYRQLSREPITSKLIISIPDEII
jgi:hypothetical protein